jgi:PleD family two-component response regulator
MDQAQTQTPKRTILLVEDELPFRQIYRDALMMSNYTVLEAENGEEALRIVEETPPDLVLLDIILPQLSGFDVLTKLKQGAKTKHIPIIVYSVLNDKASIDRAMALGADDFTIKGETPAVEVLNKARKLLGDAAAA